MIRPRTNRPWAIAAALATAAGLWGTGASLRAEGLSAVERAIVKEVEAGGAEAVRLLERVVNIPSATQDLAGVRAVGKVFEEEFRAIGLEARWEDMPAGMKRAGHLIAETKGGRGKRLLLIGHLDTVLEGKPFVIGGGGKPNRASGTGTVDMKGGDVVILQALKALHAAGGLEGRRIAVILTGDEEDAGIPVAKSRASMRELARRSDLALAFEAAIGDTATVARRGVSSWALTVKAKTGHSSGILKGEQGAGSIYEASRVVEAFRTKLAPEPDLTINPSVFVAGTEVSPGLSAGELRSHGKTNVVPGEAVVRGDLRFLSDAQRRKAEDAMRAIVAESLPKAKAEITFEDEYPSMAPTKGNYEALGKLDRVSRDLGLGSLRAYDPGKRGAGDIAFVADLVDGLDGLGLEGERSHAPDEWADLDSLPVQTKRAAILIYRLTHEEPGAK